MKRLLGLILLVLLVASIARARGDELFEKPTLEGRVLNAIPEQLRYVVPGKSKRVEVYKRLGRPLLKDKRNEFFELRRVKYDTTVTFNDDETVQTVYHQPPEPALKFRELREWVTPEQQRAIEHELNPKKPSHETGRQFSVQFPAKGYVLRFSNNPEQDLYSVLIRKPWSAGKK